MNTDRDERIDRMDEEDGDHATTGGAAAAGAVTGGIAAGAAAGGVMGAAAGPLGIAAGAVVGAAAGAIAERVMHTAAGHEHFAGDEDRRTGDRDRMVDGDGHDRASRDDLGDGRGEVVARETHRMPVREEQLSATVRDVQTGEIGVRKDVVEEQQSMNIPVEREEIRIERRPAGQPSDDHDMGEEVLRVPVYEEEVEVTKRPVVREEVVVYKNRVRENHPVNETVRREEVRIEDTRDRPRTDEDTRRN